jgi:uncharacterized membrane protein
MRRVSLYELLLTLHVVTSIIWLGAGFVLTLLALRAAADGGPGARAALNAQNDWLAPRVFIPAATLTFVFGLLLVIEGSWDLGQLWVLIGVVGWLMTFVTGFLYFKPEGERINALAEANGVDDPEVQRRFDRMESVGRVELTVLFAIVADMVIKPTGDDVGILLVGVAIIAAVAALEFASERRSRLTAVG